jgi:tyrosine-protein kinase Etk/Wzc
MDDMTRPCSGCEKPVTGALENTDSSSALKDSADEINLADYLCVISKYRRMIFWIFAVTVLVTAIISMLLPKMYAATVSVVPPMDVMQREALMAGGLGAAKSSILRQAMDVTSISDMYVGILRSRSVVDALIERFDLSRVYGEENKSYLTRKILGDRTYIKVGDEGIVAITVEDRDPCRAANLANAYVEELDRQNKRLFVGQATNKKVFLENRLKEMERDLSGIDNLLSRDAKNKEMLFDLLTKEYEIAKIEEAKSMPTIQVLDRAEPPEKKCKPKKTQMILLAGAIGLFVSVFAAFVCENLSRTPLGGKKD